MSESSAGALYRIAALVNVGPNRFQQHAPDDALAVVTARPGSRAPLLFCVVGAQVHDALERVWDIGNRMAVDSQGNRWPRDVRSLSVGDVLAVVTTTAPDTAAQGTFHAVDSLGYRAITPIPRDRIVALDGTDATSRLAPHPDTGAVPVVPSLGI